MISFSNASWHQPTPAPVEIECLRVALAVSDIFNGIYAHRTPMLWWWSVLKLLDLFIEYVSKEACILLEYKLVLTV